MTIENPILQSIFPDVPRESPAVDKNGNFTELWEIFFGAIAQALQENYKNEGIVFPGLSAANMTTIQGFYTSYIDGPYNTLAFQLPDISGQTVFDTTTYTSNQFIVAQDASSNVSLAQWVPFQMTIVNAGSPVGALAGVLNWMCYDTVNGALYICTTAGVAGTAVWTQLTSGSGGGVNSVSGTANRITSTGGANPVIDIAATYVGQTSITTLGTISTGSWAGSTIGSSYGGTGVNNAGRTITIGGNFAMSGAYTFTGTLTGNTAVTFPTSGTLATTSQLPIPAALTEVNDTNVTLTLGGTPSTALLQATSITAGWTGTLSLARGGTAANLTASNGGIFYSTASAGAILAGTATAQQILMSGASTTPAWSTATYPATTTVSQILYSSSANVIGGITTANNGVLITSNSGVPSLLANSGTVGFVLTANSGAPPSWQAVPSAPLVWAANSNASISAAVGNGYILTSGSATTVTLPTTFAVGTQIGVAGQGAAWTLALGASTNIKNFGNTYTTSLASTNNTDSVVLLATVANTTWTILHLVSTGLTAS